MTLVAGDGLASSRFFSSGTPRARGSSFDLTVGSIFDTEGKKVDGPFELKPGEMVQVVSAEVFDLSDSVTGHVTYKTELTKVGVWALTIGIVDPGWNGPVTTTLLNFSQISHAIAPGDAFLRVSLFEHEAVPPGSLVKIDSFEHYMADAQKKALTYFPSRFLQVDAVAQEASGKVIAKFQDNALLWIGAIAAGFTVITIFISIVQWSLDLPYRGALLQENAEVSQLKREVDDLQSQVRGLTAAPAAAQGSATTAPGGATFRQKSGQQHPS
jgi:deoxycytidine triphosphate deaminase